MRPVAFLAIACLWLSGGLTPPVPGGTVAQQAAEPGPTSFALISRALEAGAIDAETADKYRIFAAFGDTRLPAAYRGDDRNMPALPPEVGQVGERLETYSVATRDELAPFFMRPGDLGSWITLSTVPGQEPADADARPAGFELDGGAAAPDPPAPTADDLAGHDATAPGSTTAEPARVTWHSVPAVGGKAKVWSQDRYPGDAAIAQGLATELTSVIWPRLTGLMSQEPTPDHGIVNNGGDAALDIYLVHAPAGATATWGPPWLGLTVSSVPGVPCHAARYILVDTRGRPLGDAHTYGVIQIAAHELMHAITFAYRVRGGCPAPWIGEASGDWASNWLYPLTDAEHAFVHDYMASVEYKIDNPASPKGYDRFYGEHFLPFFLQNATGGPGFMPRMWTNFKSMDVLEGVNAILVGGFEKSWPRFLNQLWNRPPVDAPNGFKQWDRFPVGAMPTGGLDLVNVTPQAPARTITFIQKNLAQLVFESGVQPIAGHYRHYRFEPDVRGVLFHNTIAEEGIGHGTVWAIENIGGTWKQPIDLTKEWQKFWCRDHAQENLDELVLIFGNIDWKNNLTVNPQDPPAIEAYGFGCRGWTGTAQVTITEDLPDLGSTVVQKAFATIRLEPDSAALIPGKPPQLYISTGGSASWRVRVSGACSGGGSGGQAIPKLPYDHMASLDVSEGGSGNQVYVTGGQGPWPDPIPTFTLSCPNGTITPPILAATAILNTDPVQRELAPDGKSFGGRWTRTAPGVVFEWRYSFRCIGC
jgi:hypothetical protein